MFTTQSPEQLMKLLNEFSLPMFAVERGVFAPGFQMICINEAFEKASGIPQSRAKGTWITDLFKPEDAADMNRTYTHCTKRACDFRYREQFSMPCGPVEWDISLQHIKLENGNDRIIGTALDMADEKLARSACPSLEDVQFLAAMAELQIQNLITTLEKGDIGAFFRPEHTHKTERLAALCRAVQRSLEDIKRLAHSMERNASASIPNPLINKDNQQTFQTSLRAMYDAVDDPRPVQTEKPNLRSVT